MFFLSLVFIFLTESGNLLEILLVFIIYISADLCIMIMVSLMEENDYRSASIFQLLGNIIFTLLFLYHFLVNGQGHYILGSIAMLMGVYKNIKLYHYKKDVFWIHNISLILINVLIFGFAYYIFQPSLNGQLIFQVLGIILFTGCLVMKDDFPRIRYFQGFIGLSFMVFGSGYGIYLEYLDTNIYGVTVSYFLMPLTVLLVYAGSFKKYI